MTDVPKVRLLTTTLIVLAVIAGAAGAAWWLLGRAHLLYSSLDRTFAVAILTALACTLLIVWAFRSSGASRAARIRGQSEAYEAILSELLREGTGRMKVADLRRNRARLLLWGSGRVLREFIELELDDSPLDVNLPEGIARLTPLIQAMRSDLGQSSFGIRTIELPEADAE